MPKDDSKTLTFSFHGSLAVPNERPSEFSATIRFPRWDPTALAVDLLWFGTVDERRKGAFALRHLGGNHVWLNSLDPRQGAVELLGIDEVRTVSAGSLIHSSSVRVAAVQIGITEEKHEKARKLDAIVRLQPSGILCLPAIHKQHFTGELQIERIESGTATLRFRNSEFEARETFEYYDTVEDGNSVTHRVQRASLIGKVNVGSATSLFDVHEEMKREIGDVCTALSLCYRQPVDCYEIEYWRRDDNNVPLQQAIYRRRWATIKTKMPGNELINMQALVGDGLERLVTQVQTSPRSADVRHAIKFLAASYTATTEVAFFMAFSAMETILSCCLEPSEEFVVGASQWKKVEQGLRRAIDDHFPEDNDVRTGLRDKLPELRRSTLSRRITKACQKYSPTTADLWPGISFEEGMKRAATIRNGLFHAADAGAQRSIGGDLLRVRTFAERLLLRLLAWPDEAIWTWYDQDLKWANQAEQ